MSLQRYADYISGRQLFNDWEREDAIHFEITQLGAEGNHREPYTPDIANWVDTRGHREGFMTTRWAYSETPTTEDWPRVSARKVPFNEIESELPEDTVKVTPAERCKQIAVRQQHVQKRYRVFQALPARAALYPVWPIASCRLVLSL